MTAGHYLFGFSGRINRAKWWLLILIQIGAAIVFNIAVAIVFGTGVLGVMSAGSAFGAMASAGSSIGLLALLYLAYAILMFVIWLAVTVKRLHDRDKSGAWILLFAVGPWVCFGLGFAMAFGHAGGGLSGLISLAGFAIVVWAFVELGCLRGTIGNNPYGPDPLAMMYAGAAPPSQPA